MVKVDLVLVGPKGKKGVPLVLGLSMYVRPLGAVFFFFSYRPPTW